MKQFFITKSKAQELDLISYTVWLLRTQGKNKKNHQKHLKFNPHKKTQKKKKFNLLEFTTPNQTSYSKISHHARLITKKKKLKNQKILPSNLTNLMKPRQEMATKIENSERSEKHSDLRDSRRGQELSSLGLCLFWNLKDFEQKLFKRL